MSPLGTGALVAATITGGLVAGLFTGFAYGVLITLAWFLGRYSATGQAGRGREAPPGRSGVRALLVHVGQSACPGWWVVAGGVRTSARTLPPAPPRPVSTPARSAAADSGPSTTRGRGGHRPRGVRVDGTAYGTNAVPAWLTATDVPVLDRLPVARGAAGTPAEARGQTVSARCTPTSPSGSPLGVPRGGRGGHERAGPAQPPDRCRRRSPPAGVVPLVIGAIVVHGGRWEFDPVAGVVAWTRFGPVPC
ncbi:hypothetical protein C1701_17100 [Actinoalloteichus sp. AHMU CJ021]|uniref:hypothetical protein n=1 Tax=Actinoalloteichus sp. AHMU CJ021 TaxID=2072503 RepID=UPI000CA04F02|nr:hypothetical protein C1701_17100 [Actinoalloteichus sp. AHMU CJ021]